MIQVSRAFIILVAVLSLIVGFYVGRVVESHVVQDQVSQVIEYVTVP